jgi:hypothetical protein
MTVPTLIDDSPVHLPLTADALLFGAGADTAETLSRAISELGVTRSALRSVRRLSGSAVAVVDREIATVTESLLDLDLGDVLLSAWQKYSKLTGAARRTLAVSGSEEIVSLVAHKIQSTYSPHVDLVVDGVLIHSFTFELAITFEVMALQAVVSAGTLAALRGGGCVITANLGLEGVELVRTARPVDLELIVRLHPPRPLITSSVVSQPSLAWGDVR